MSKDFPNREDWLEFRKRRPERSVLHKPDIDPKTGKMIPLRRLEPKKKNPA